MVVQTETTIFLSPIEVEDIIKEHLDSTMQKKIKSIHFRIEDKYEGDHPTPVLAEVICKAD